MSACNDELVARLGIFRVLAIRMHYVHVREMQECDRAYLTVNVEVFDQRHKIEHAA